MQKQLTLSQKQLIKVGFKKRVCRFTNVYGKRQTKTVYEIPYQHGVFRYNFMEEKYKWYQQINVNKDLFYDIHLDISCERAMWDLFVVFNVKTLIP